MTTSWRGREAHQTLAGSGVVLAGRRVRALRGQSSGWGQKTGIEEAMHKQAAATAKNVLLGSATSEGFCVGAWSTNLRRSSFEIAC